MPTDALELIVLSYDELDDTFSLGQTGENVEVVDIDIDDFTVPAVVLACLLGEWGEPSEFVGRKFTMKLPS